MVKSMDMTAKTDVKTPKIGAMAVMIAIELFCAIQGSDMSPGPNKYMDPLGNPFWLVQVPQNTSHGSKIEFHGNGRNYGHKKP